MLNHVSDWWLVNGDWCGLRGAWFVVRGNYQLSIIN